MNILLYSFLKKMEGVKNYQRKKKQQENALFSDKFGAT